MAYDSQDSYRRFESESGSESSSSCGCSSTENKCSCCPPGLVEVKDTDGNSMGCLSPNDAQQYKKDSVVCSEGYIRVIVDGEFLGCLTPVEYASYLESQA